VPAESLYGSAQAGYSRIWLAALAVLMIALVLFFSADLVWRGLEPRWPGPGIASVAAASLAAVLLLRTVMIRGGSTGLRIACLVLLAFAAFLLGSNLLYLPSVGLVEGSALGVVAVSVPVATLLTFSNFTAIGLLQRDAAVVAASCAAIAVLPTLWLVPDNASGVLSSLIATGIGLAWAACAIVVATLMKSVAIGE